MTLPSEGRGGRLPPIPFLTTSFAVDLQCYLILWPVWWLLGVEQLLPPVFLAWELFRSALRRRGVLTVNPAVILAAALALWSMVPGLWVPADHRLVFLRELAISWSQVAILLLFVNEVRTRRAWDRVAAGLLVLAGYIAVGSVIAVSGLWSGEVVSLLGALLPDPLVARSAFFDSIAHRGFSLVGAQTDLPRITSFALQASALSMVSLVLLPFVIWRQAVTRRHRYAQLLCAAGLLVSLVFAQSRMAFLAALAGLVLLSTILVFRRSDWSIRIALIGLFAGLALLTATLLWSDIVASFETLLIESRPGSWITRARVYRETLELLPEHLVAGWGVAVQIPGLTSVYSAGTHSSYLGMLFQHGVVGLALYLGLWLTIWLQILRGFRESRGSSVPTGFWIMAAVAMFCFNLREAADTWWWDQLVTLTVWCLWGLILTRSRTVDSVPRAAEAGSSR